MAYIFFLEEVLPLLLLGIFLKGSLFYFWTPDLPVHTDVALSRVSSTAQCDIDEELDTYPSSRPPAIVSVRYDRLRRVAGALQTRFGDVSGSVEKLFLLISWRDQCATAMCLLFCLIAGFGISLLTHASD
ncbi:unnamed protein product [Arabis nemorensis]|uniref:Multiple C2 domain-containing protein n=1 Tax=Arabis nemorensis TaxID=586526 RepID=A0A565BPT7_9BRAS|nr:unnamed protein product [Arabis nemorensis]